MRWQCIVTAHPGVGMPYLFEYRCDLLNKAGLRSGAWWFDAASDDEALDYALSFFDEDVTGDRFELWRGSALIRSYSFEPDERGSRKLERT